MKRFTKAVLSVATLATVFSFSSCQSLWADLVKMTNGGGTESSAQDTANGEGEWNDWLQYAIFDGEYQEVDAATVKAKIVDDARYEKDSCYGVWKNNIGTYIEWRMHAGGTVNGQTVGYLDKACCKVLRESMEDDAAYLAQVVKEWDGEESVEYYEGVGLGFTPQIPDGADMEELGFILNQDLAWWGLFEEGLDEDGIVTSLISPLEVTWSICEEQEYIKVRMVNSGKWKMISNGTGEKIFVTQNTGAMWVFTRELDLIATACWFKLDEEGTFQINGELSTGVGFDIMGSVCVPWEGTIEMPADLPTSTQ